MGRVPVHVLEGVLPHKGLITYLTNVRAQTTVDLLVLCQGANSLKVLSKLYTQTGVVHFASSVK